MSLKVTMKIILMKKNFSISKGEEEKKNWRWKKVMKEIEKNDLKNKTNHFIGKTFKLWFICK